VATGDGMGIHSGHRVFVSLIAGADLFYEKSTTGSLLVLVCSGYR
jgi:hypothetical protein